MESDIWARSHGNPTLGHIDLVGLFFFFPGEFCFKGLLISLFLPGFLSILLTIIYFNLECLRHCVARLVFYLLLVASQPSVFSITTIILLYWIIFYFDFWNAELTELHRHHQYASCSLLEMFSLFSFIMTVTIGVNVLLNKNRVEDNKKFNLQTTTPFLTFRTALQITKWALAMFQLVCTALQDLCSPREVLSE